MSKRIVYPLKPNFLELIFLYLRALTALNNLVLKSVFANTLKDPVRQGKPLEPWLEQSSPSAAELATREEDRKNTALTLVFKFTRIGKKTICHAGSIAHTVGQFFVFFISAVRSVRSAKRYRMRFCATGFQGLALAPGIIKGAGASPLNAKPL